MSISVVRYCCGTKDKEKENQLQEATNALFPTQNERPPVGVTDHQTCNPTNRLHHLPTVITPPSRAGNRGPWLSDDDSHNTPCDPNEV